MTAETVSADKNGQNAGESERKPDYAGHRDRLRQKIILFGAGTLQDYELLEALLMAAIPRRDVKPLAKKMIEVFGDFESVISASPEALRRISGIKDSSVALFLIVREAALRMLKNRISDAPVINSWDKLVAYCRADMAQRKTEAFRVLFLDNQSRLIKDEIMQQGTVDQTAVYPREVAARALELGATSLIMVHNHPAGSLRPSKNDIAMTKNVQKALDVLGIALLDHFIVSKSGYLSFKDCGYL